MSRNRADFAATTYYCRLGGRGRNRKRLALSTATERKVWGDNYWGRLRRGRAVTA